MAANSIFATRYQNKVGIVQFLTIKVACISVVVRRGNERGFLAPNILPVNTLEERVCLQHSGRRAVCRVFVQ